MPARSSTPSECLALGYEARKLIISESEPLVAKLLLQHAILLNQAVDHLGLVAIDPACEGGDWESK